MSTDSSSQSASNNPRTAYHQFLDRWHPDHYRQQEVVALTQAVQARENRLLLGLPGMGISNLMRFVASQSHRLLSVPTAVAYINCDALEDCQNPTLLFTEIIYQFHKQGVGVEQSLSTNDYTGLSRLLTQTNLDLSARLLIMIDQANRLLAEADASFYRQLKALSDLNKRVCYIMAASANLEDKIDPEDLLFAGRRIYVGPLNEVDIKQIIEEEAERLGATFDPATNAYLSQVTGGHPGLLRAVSSALVAEDIRPQTPNALNRLTKREDVEYRCRKIWRDLDISQRITLYHLVMGQVEKGDRHNLTWLKQVGLVKKFKDHLICFSPLLQQFVRQQGLPLAAISLVDTSAITVDGQKIVVTGKILKGAQEVQLSPLLLRLLACLSRQARIYSKDEIAAYVYYDDYAKGIAIQDQRIENLVRQLRQRLGKEYIKAHWGQGYELLRE